MVSYLYLVCSSYIYNIFLKKKYKKKGLWIIYLFPVFYVYGFHWNEITLQMEEDNYLKKIIRWLLTDVKINTDHERF